MKIMMSERGHNSANLTPSPVIGQRVISSIQKTSSEMGQSIANQNQNLIIQIINSKMKKVSDILKFSIPSKNNQE